MRPKPQLFPPGGKGFTEPFARYRILPWYVTNSSTCSGEGLTSLAPYVAFAPFHFRAFSEAFPHRCAKPPSEPTRTSDTRPQTPSRPSTVTLPQSICCFPDGAHKLSQRTGTVPTAGTSFSPRVLSFVPDLGVFYVILYSSQDRRSTPYSRASTQRICRAKRRPTTPLPVTRTFHDPNVGREGSTSPLFLPASEERLSLGTVYAQQAAKACPTSALQACVLGTN